MAESTLSLKKADYESEVGVYSGIGPGAAFGGVAWTDEETAKVQRDVASGLRRFYFNGYDWSFLKPFASVSFPLAATTITMPDDFGGLEGRIAVSLSTSVFAPIDFGNPGQVQQLYSQFPSLTGRPQLASLRPIKQMPTNKGQRHELFIFPAADAAYTLTFQYYILPNYLLDTTQPYAYGGAEHSETILESCLAVCEQRRDESRFHKDLFDELLANSIKMDRRKKPQKMGGNFDRSDDNDVLLVPMRGLNPSAVTVNGVEYS